MKGKKLSDMPPGMTYKEAINWLKSNYNGPGKGMSLSLANGILLRSGYKYARPSERAA